LIDHHGYIPGAGANRFWCAVSVYRNVAVQRKEKLSYKRYLFLNHISCIMMLRISILIELYLFPTKLLTPQKNLAIVPL